MLNAAQGLRRTLAWQPALPGPCSPHPAKPIDDHGFTACHRHFNSYRRVSQPKEMISEQLIHLPKQFLSSLQSP
jgi:hypothetical protein